MGQLFYKGNSMFYAYSSKRWANYWWVICLRIGCLVLSRAEDLYLQEVWDIDNNGKFTKPVEGTMGLLVNYNTVDYIELFKAEGE